VKKDNGDPKTYAIIGAAMEVHGQLGCGFLEAVYHEALALELALRNVPYAQEVELPISYKGQRLVATYRADFISFGCIIAKLKALQHPGAVEESQIINYLKASGYEVGLLLNFGSKSLEYRRFVLSKSLEG
jgi:GxxExxY protein